MRDNNSLDRSRHTCAKLAGYASPILAPLKHLRVDGRLGQLFRYLALPIEILFLKTAHASDSLLYALPFRLLNNFGADEIARRTKK